VKSNGNYHLQRHHQQFDSQQLEFSDNKSAPEDVLSDSYYIIIKILGALPLVSLLFIIDRFGALLVLFIAIAYHLAVEIIHFYFHKPTDASFEGSALFKNLQWYHRLHHSNPKYNFGTIINIWDQLWDTQKNTVDSSKD
jgi:sterol desaturase/sphingolipid hydroxylase (fatty acid hydroxylase superfamily)